MTIWTIGHSTRSIDDFLSVLSGHDIQLLIDVRRFPGSRRLPHFGREALEGALSAAGIGYLWLPALGGRRAPRRDSPNSGWRNDAFRGYADHLESAEFAGGIDSVLTEAARRRTAIMCAEALWWQCHRRLIADWLVAHGHEVLHLRDASAAEPHRLEPPGRLVDGRLSYAPEHGPDDQPTLRFDE